MFIYRYKVPVLHSKAKESGRVLISYNFSDNLQVVPKKVPDRNQNEYWQPISNNFKSEQGMEAAGGLQLLILFSLRNFFGTPCTRCTKLLAVSGQSSRRMSISEPIIKKDLRMIALTGTRCKIRFI